MRLQPSRSVLIAAAVPLVLGAATVPALAQAPGPGASPVLKRVAERGRITIGHREASPPYSYLSAQQKVEGYSIDFCLRVVDAVKERLGRPDLQVAYVPINTTSRIPLVANGTVDIECGTTTNTLARHEQVAFSPVFYLTGTQLLVRSGAEVKDFEDLKGKRVAVLQGSSNESSLRALNDQKQLGVSLVYAKDLGEGALLVESDRVDAFAADGGQIQVYAATKARRPGSLAVVGRLLTYDPYSTMFQRGDADFALLVTRTYADLFRSGEAERIYERWFSPLSIPLDPLLRAAFQIQALPR